MTTRITKSGIDVREIATQSNNRPLSVAGQAMMTAPSHTDQFNLISAGRKNIIINGDMRIAQRATSVAGLTTQAHTTVDRWSYNMFNVGSCTRTDSQETTGGPYGFPYSKKMLYTTAQTTNANSRQQIRYMVEGYDMGGLAWGTQRAKPVTLSFWAKSNVPGKHAFNMINQSETHSFISNYELKVPNEWEYVVITIPGPSVGTWNDDERIGIRLAWDTGSGSDFEVEDSFKDQWLNQWKYRLSSSSRIAEVTNGYLQITGVQLEVGKIATPFEHRHIGHELTLCERYWQRLSITGMQIVKNGTGTTYSVADLQTSLPLRTEMRDLPSAGAFTGGPTITAQAYSDTYTAVGTYELNISVRSNQLVNFLYQASNNGGAALPANVTMLAVNEDAYLYSEI
jgi:hypothetical protein